MRVRRDDEPEPFTGKGEGEGECSDEPRPYIKGERVKKVQEPIGELIGRFKAVDGRADPEDLVKGDDSLWIESGSPPLWSGPRRASRATPSHQATQAAL